MSLVLQVSDPHFGTERAPVVRALERLAHAQHPSLLVLSGDITQRARRRQFAAARAFVDRVAAGATLVVPGNHDIPLFDLPTRLLDPYRNHRRAFGADLEPEHETEDLLVVGVNTTRRYRHKHGEVSGAQVERVATRLARARPGQLRIVVTHQPVLVPTVDEEINLLRGHRQALRTWAGAGADLLVGGHIHLPYVRSAVQQDPVPARQVWVVQAGTAVSRRVRGGIPNSVNLIRHRCDTGVVACVVERWDFNDASEEFVRIESTSVALDRG